MARFRAVIQGNRGSASRLGSAHSGLQANVNGWDVGVEVAAHAEGENDSFFIYMTGGSNDSHPTTYIGRVTLVNGKPVFYTGNQND